MKIMDRLLGRHTEQPAPVSGGSALSEKDMDEIAEIARRTIPAAAERTCYFVCSGNESLIAAFNDLYRVGAPIYGGTAGMYRADRGTLDGRAADPEAAAKAFSGKSYIGSQATEIATAADALSAMKTEAFGGTAYVAYVDVGPTGQDWVREVYDTLLGEAAKQGILPFSLYTTADEASARYVRDSLTSLA